MGARGRGGRRGRKGGGEGGGESDERWLLTYADMITLLMALFMVLFSISSVNTSKFESLQRALQEAFSGRILSGGKSIAQTGSEPTAERPAPEVPIASIQPSQEQVTRDIDDPDGTQDRSAARAEDRDLRRIEQQIQQAAAQENLSDHVQTEVTRRGLVVRLLTDEVGFDSGAANLKPRVQPLLRRMAALIEDQQLNPIRVEGHTDSQPIRTGSYPTNWELSTARATAVVRFLIGSGLGPSRLGAAGYAYLHPVARNDSTAGRARNRRVEIVVERVHDEPTDGGAP